MNRRTLDTAIPMLYALVVVVMYMTVGGNTATVVTVAGAILVGTYYAAFRRNLPPG